MSTPAATSKDQKFISAIMEKVKPFLVPYYLTIAGVLGAMTAGFVTLIVVIILIAANCNVLGLIE